jgi:hypothetical protein
MEIETLRSIKKILWFSDVKYYQPFPEETPV